MSEPLIKSELTGSVLRLTLNRPDKLNSFIEPMAKLLQGELQKAGGNEEVRAVLLRAEGKAFCAGQDLPEVVGREKEEDGYQLADTVRSTYNPIIRAIRHLEKPVVCAVQGTAAGAGANIAFACDIVLAAEEAVFIQSFSKIGLIPDSGGTFFLPRLAGLARANALYMLDEKLTAVQAIEFGLIHKAVPKDQLADAVESIAGKLASMPTRGFGLYKRAVNASMSNSLDEQLDLEARLQSEAGYTEDYHEGVDAFLNKRKPNYKGS